MRLGLFEEVARQGNVPPAQVVLVLLVGLHCVRSHSMLTRTGSATTRSDGYQTLASIAEKLMAAELPLGLGEDEIEDYEPTEEDDRLRPEDLEGLVLYPLDWSVQSLLERIGKTFDINPSFQRRDAWTQERKSLYIESLMLGLPVPQIVLAEDPNEKGRFIVLDGKQRLITIKQFATPDSGFPALRLKRLEFLSTELEGLTYAEIAQSPSLKEYSDSLLSQPVRTVVVRNWQRPALLYQIFVRLNQNSVSLSPQELRQALYPGPFTTWLNQRSAESDLLHRARRLRGQDFRMRDAEMLLRYVALSNRLKQYRGNLRLFLDDMCSQGNRDWNDRQDLYRHHGDSCEAAIERVFVVFGESDSFLRYADGRYVRRFNVAVYDALTPVFGADEITEDDVRGSAVQLREAFQRLCTDDDAFQQSLIVTTKTREATIGRIATWGRAVEQVVGKEVEIVRMAHAALSGV